MSVTTSELATIKLPAHVAALFEGEEVPNWALEAILVEAVRGGRCSRGFMRDVLDMELNAAEGLLKSRNVYYDYTNEELEEMVAAAMPKK